MTRRRVGARSTTGTTSSSISSPACGPSRHPPATNSTTTVPIDADVAEADAIEIGADIERSTSMSRRWRRCAGDADSPFRRRDAELTPLIVASARKLKRVLADEQNDVLDRLRRSEPVRDLDGLLPERDEHIDTFAVAIDAELRSAATAGAASVATGRAAKLNKSAMADAVGAGRTALGEWLVNPLRDRLERCVVDGAGDNDAITKSVRSIYREWKTQHIDDQLDDVLRTAHGRAVLVGAAGRRTGVLGRRRGAPGVRRRRRQRARRLCRGRSAVPDGASVRSVTCRVPMPARSR